MSIHDFASTILFGTSLEDKLIRAPLHFRCPQADPLTLNTPALKSLPLAKVPSFPGRPAQLSLLQSGNTAKALFPPLHRLHENLTRGQILHFFANHELLAMELMALVLLRFPDAPPEFRQGIVKTISEEQSHLQLYLNRMKELGVQFGDIPVSDYFWKSMKGMNTPLDFVVQMSLTFEQANLDFSLYFMKAVKSVGDDKTAAILEQVYREEIGHVKHGVSWFNRWRENSDQESDWDAYQRLLPLPMTPRRAKGFEYSEAARRKTGLSEEFIAGLSVFSSSKGRPPVIWKYNPHCDSEIARGRPGFSPSAGAKRVTLDLETLPLFLAQDQDVVLVEHQPESVWLKEIQTAGFHIPEFSSTVKSAKLGGFEPWGWSPDSFDFFKTYSDRLSPNAGANAQWVKRFLSASEFNDVGIGSYFSKSWSAKFLKKWIQDHPESVPYFGDGSEAGSIFGTFESATIRIRELLSQGSPVMLKAPFGTSGMQVKKVAHIAELTPQVEGWIRNTVSNQNEIVVEHYLEKIMDLSIQFEINKTKTEIFEPRRFSVGSRLEYRGTFLGKKLLGLDRNQTRFFHEAQAHWNLLIQDLGNELRADGIHCGYRGPVGIDALLWKTREGQIKLKPIVEINPRWTMGRIALALEQKIAPGIVGLWSFVSMKDIEKSYPQNSVDQYVRDLRAKFPLKQVKAGGGLRIESGVVFTTDPLLAGEILTILFVGDDAVSHARHGSGNGLSDSI